MELPAWMVKSRGDYYWIGNEEDRSPVFQKTIAYRWGHADIEKTENSLPSKYAFLRFLWSREQIILIWCDQAHQCGVSKADKARDKTIGHWVGPWLRTHRRQ
jgi:hypothetical protein